MAKPRRKLHLAAYYLRQAMTKEAFAGFWAQMARAPFAAQKYGNVERMKLQFSQDAEPRAHRMLELGLLLVRGKGLAYFVRDKSTIDRFMLDIDPGSMGHRSRETWIAWLVDLFDSLSAVFAFGCLESEFHAKHTVEFQDSDGIWRSDSRGFRPADLKTCLPGVYWLNYYGSEIGEHLGQRVATNENLEVTHLSRDRYLALLKEPLTPVDLKERLALERKIAKEIGENYFWDPESPSSKKEQVPRLAAMLQALPG